MPKHLTSEAAIAVLEVERSKKLLNDAKKVDNLRRKLSPQDYCKKCKLQYKANKDWIQCDTCERWFHFECTGLEIQVMKSKVHPGAVAENLQ